MELAVVEEKFLRTREETVMKHGAPREQVLLLETRSATSETLSNIIGEYYVGDNKAESNAQPLSGVAVGVKGQLERITPILAAVMCNNKSLYHGKALCLSIVKNLGFNSPPHLNPFAKQQSLQSQNTKSEQASIPSQTDPTLIFFLHF